MSKSGSANTAILAIFVLVLLAMIGFFILRHNDKPEEKVEFSVDLPEVVDVDAGKPNGN